MPCMPPPPDLRAADHRLGHLHAAGADVQVALVDLRLVDARGHAGRELAPQPAAAAPRLGGLGLRGLELVRLLARLDVDLDAALVRAADPHLLGRPHPHLRRRRSRPARSRRPAGVKLEAALVVGLWRRRRRRRRARWPCSRPRSGSRPCGGPEARSGLTLVLCSSNGWMPSSSGAVAAVDLVRLGVRDDLQLPDPRLGLGDPRRVEVDLHLLLVGAAGAVGDQVDRVGQHGVPLLGQPVDVQLVVVDDPALVADSARTRTRSPGCTPIASVSPGVVSSSGRRSVIVAAACSGGASGGCGAVGTPARRPAPRCAAAGPGAARRGRCRRRGAAAAGPA